MPARVFISYSHKDEDHRNQLDAQLAILKRAGIVEIWHDRRLVAGDDFDHSIKQELEAADIILLLVSSDFLKSDYISDVEIARAMARHEAGEARVVPVILRPCPWQHAPFAKLQALPKEGKAVTKWPNTDEAFLDIANGIERAAKELRSVSKAVSAPKPLPDAPHISHETPRSGNMRITKTFTDRDKDQFRDEAFEYIKKYFEGSLQELAERYPANITSKFRPIDANKFTAAIYRGGRKEASCTVSVGGMLAGIAYSTGDEARDNSYNELLTTKIDEQAIYLQTLAGGYHYSDEEKLSMEGAAELLWSRLIEPLQR